MKILGAFKPVTFLGAFFNLILLGICIFLIVSHSALPPQLPLWFSKPWGSVRLAAPINLWIIPALLVGFFVASHFTAKLLGKNNPKLAKMLVWSTAFIATVFLLTLYKIILVAL